MIAEVLLILAGHSSSLFQTDYTLNPAISSLLHPGEQQCLESLGLIAYRYRNIKTSCAKLSHSPSRYICALCATLNHVLKEEYESLVIQTEAKVLRREHELVANGTFVPLSLLRAIFSEWEAPFAALTALFDEIDAENDWKPGPLIDLLVTRSKTGVHRVGSIISKLSVAIQRVWRTQLTAFLVHGSLSASDPLAGQDFTLIKEAVPTCVSGQSRNSIAYIGRAIGIVKTVKRQKQPPKELAMEHTNLLGGVLPQDQHAFDLVISQMRTNIGEWLWLNVLTKKDVDEAVDSLANYFLFRNGEFGLSLIREIERLKLSRLTSRPGTALIREQDLNLTILRASLGTTAQHDPYLSRLRFILPEGPVRPLLPSLTNDEPQSTTSTTKPLAASLFDTLLLGTTTMLSYDLTWPLDLFLDSADLAIYSCLFSFLSALRKTHTKVHICWTSLSNAQRARRRWTGFGEGGTSEDVDIRANMLRCGWGVVRNMSWFLDTLLGYVMMDVVDTEFRTLKASLSKHREGLHSGIVSGAQQVSTSHLDFATLRAIHNNYLGRLVDGCLLSNNSFSLTMRQILDVCERFVALVERWGGDVLPALLFEGSIMDEGQQEVGTMVKARWTIVAEIDETLRGLLEIFYEQLTQSISQPLSAMTLDGSRSAFFGGVSQTTQNISRTGKGLDKEVVQSFRHVDRLLLRLDFNGELSRPRTNKDKDILADL